MIFKNLSKKLNFSFSKLKDQGYLSEDNIRVAMREVRRSLLEADVALPVVKEFINHIEKEALGEKIKKSLTPGQTLISIVKRRITYILGSENKSLNLNTQPPAIILIAGLQGSGKTTSTAKLANFLKNRQQKKVMVVSTDIYRPAAIQQLILLAKKINVEAYSLSDNQTPLEIAKNAIILAKKKFFDVVIIDTAGRLHVDDKMMTEIKYLHQNTNPIETLFVVDSMTGQDAVNMAKSFNDTLPLTGVILTKADGDSRGGVALSVLKVTGKPIKFIGVGEKLEHLEPFYPDRIASRILGMGDVVSLIEEVEKNLDKDKAKEWSKKFKRAKSFTLDDFKDQLQQMKKIGGINSIMDKIPGVSNLKGNLQNRLNENTFQKMEIIINSMTFFERRRPDCIKSSRKRRISRGSGTTSQDINRLLKQFMQMQKMVKSMKKRGVLRQMMETMKSNK